MRISWTPSTLVRSAGLLDGVSGQHLPGVPLRGLPVTDLPLVLETMGTSEGSAAAARGAATIERNHLWNVAGRGDGVAAAESTLWNLWNRIQTGKKAHKSFRYISKALTGDGAQWVRRRLAGAERRGTYANDLLGKWEGRAIRAFAKKDGVLSRVGGKPAQDFLKKMAAGRGRDLLSDTWGKSLLTGKATVKEVGRLKVLKGGLSVLGLALDSKTFVDDVQGYENAKGTADRNRKATDAVVHGAAVAADVVFVAAMFTPVGPVALGVAGAVAASAFIYDHREAIGQRTAVVAKWGIKHAAGIGSTLKKLF